MGVWEESLLLARFKTTRRSGSGKSLLLSLLFIIFMAHCLNDALDTIYAPADPPSQACCSSGGPTRKLLSKLNPNEPANDVAPRDITQAIRKHLRTLCVASLWLANHKGVHAIRLLRVEAPDRPHAGTPVKLRCVYETKGDRLQSLSWYKDGHEFYRYQPYERSKQLLIFNQTGVTVDLSRSKSNFIVLTNTTTDTSGRYKCEVTVNTFQEANMATTLEFQTASSSSSYSVALLASVLPPLVAITTHMFLHHRI